MKKTTFIKSIFATLLIVSSAFTTKADEGMWLIHLMAQTNYEAMKAKGVELSAEEIYSETTPSLKDAIVALDFGSCTGSMISKNGLMITNHHCAYDDIQKLSSLEHDYLKNGFWSKNQGEEIRIPGKTVMFLDRVIDVTDEYRKVLKSLEKEDIKTLILRAVNDTQKGMGAYHAVIDEDALDFLADISNGDARAALTAVELGILTTERSGDGLIHITLSVASECIQKRVVKYDKSGDNHYDTVSAFIKSMRGSDPDAAVYYLARMLYAGEDIRFIARRIMICASEDVSNADPMALVVATSAAQAVERIGMPEAQIILAQAVTYVASAPKSNAAVTAISEAMETVKNTMTAPVPPHLQDAHYKSSSKLGHGVGYKYAHDYPNHYVEQQYLPDGLTGRKFYRPSENGYEKQIREYFHKIKGEYSHE